MTMKKMLVVMSLALAQGAGATLTETTSDMTADGDWEVTVAADETNVVTVALSGDGHKIVKKGPGQLTLTCDSTFSGGVEIREGIVMVDPATASGTFTTKALGTGTVTIWGVHDGYTGRCELDVFGAKTKGARKVTVPNAINVTGNTTSDAPALFILGADTVFTGKITAAQDFFFFDDFVSTKVISTSMYNRYTYVTSATFGEITAGGRVANTGVCKFVYKGKVTTPKFDLTVSRPTTIPGQSDSSHWNFHSAHEFTVPCAIDWLARGGIHPIAFKCDNVLDGDRMEWSYQDNCGVGVTELTQCKLTVAAVESPSRFNSSGDWSVQSVSGASELVVNGGKGDQVPAEVVNHNVMLKSGSLSLTVDAYDSFTQTFNTTNSHAMSGAITVKKGTLRFTKSDEFPNVTAVVVDGGVLDASAAQKSPFVAGVTLPALTIANGGVLKLPEGTQLRVQNLTVNGTTYESPTVLRPSDLPGQLVGVTILGLGTGGAIMWNGQADENLTNPGNWDAEEALLDFSGGTMPVGFALSGGRATVNADVLFVAVTFDAAEGTDGFALCRDATPHGLSVAGDIAATGDAEAAKRYVIDAPLTLAGAQNVVSAEANKTLVLSNALATASSSGGRLCIGGAGKVEFAGENVIGGALYSTSSMWRVTGRLSSPDHVYEGRPADDGTGSVILDINYPGSKDGATTCGMELNNAVVEKSVLVKNHMGASSITTVANTTNEVKGFVRFVNASHERFSLKGKSELTLSGGLETVHSFRIYEGGTLRIREKPASFTGSAGLNPSAGTVVLEAPNNTFVYLCLGYNNGSTVKVETTVDYALTNGNVQVGGNGGSVAKAVALTSGTFTLDLHSTTQRCQRIGVMTKGILTGTYPAMLEVTEGRPATGEFALPGYSIVGQVTGGVGLHMCGDEGSVLLLTNRTFTSCGDLKVSSGILEFADDAFWPNGTNVTVAGTGVLKLGSGRTFGRQANLSLATGGALEIPSGETLTVKFATLDGQDVPAGTYHKGELGGTLTGEGTLVVRGGGLLMIVR